ncbi:MAG: type II toxin-antitoxin system VapC family toxin [Bauldia sp.]|nr:type II toxin-antitoxin system VapC family toxin [Bauldia sp.]
MNLLLDTQIVLWVTTNDPKLRPKARETIELADEVFVSSIAIWEIAIKASAGKLVADVAELAGHLVRRGFRSLPVTWAHAQTVRDLPFHHGDPFDRMLVAQAMTEPLRLLTADRLLARYSELVTVV